MKPPVAPHTYRYVSYMKHVAIIMESPGIGQREIFRHDKVGGFIAANLFARQRGIVLDRNKRNG